MSEAVPLAKLVLCVLCSSRRHLLPTTQCCCSKWGSILSWAMQTQPVSCSRVQPESGKCVLLHWLIYMRLCAFHGHRRCIASRSSYMLNVNMHVSIHSTLVLFSNAVFYSTSNLCLSKSMRKDVQETRVIWHSGQGSMNTQCSPCNSFWVVEPSQQLFIITLLILSISCLLGRFEGRGWNPQFRHVVSYE